MNKWIKCAIIAAAVALVGYNSIYIRKLSDVQNAAKALDFDAKVYAQNFLHTTLPAHAEAEHPPPAAVADTSSSTA